MLRSQRDFGGDCLFLGQRGFGRGFGWLSLRCRLGDMGLQPHDRLQLRGSGVFGGGDHRLGRSGLRFADRLLDPSRGQEKAARIRGRGLCGRHLRDIHRRVFDRR